MKRILVYTAALFLVLSCQSGQTAKQEVKMENTNSKVEIATLAGGCFWCVESDLEKVPGILEVVSGYAGGIGDDPTYETYAKKGYIEAVQIRFDPSRITFEQLLDHFWRLINPTDAGGQFVDRGPYYRSVIFYHDETQKKIAKKSLASLEKSGRFDKPIATEILQFTKFYNAEDYHQDFYKKNPIRYKAYRLGSGRDQFLEKVWGNEQCPLPSSPAKVYKKPDRKSLEKKLSSLQYQVTQNEGTEPPFRNEYWNNKRQGIYVDIASGEPLFSSIDKYDSGTGWPSFSRPLEPGNIVEKEDNSLFMKRTEVRSRYGDSHLGHVFTDGPAPTGLRYCMNSAALRFIPKEDLEKEGYGQYSKLFE